jgi:hypothetical protein
VPVGDLAIIDRYAEGLAAALRGPRRLRADLVAEARDSLLDATEAHIDAGMPPVAAAQRAVAEFGRHREIVPGYQRELAAAQGKRTVLWLATVLPLLHLLAPLMWWRGPWLGTSDPGAGYWALTADYDYLSIGASLAAVILLAGFGWGSRYISDSVRYARAVGIAVLAFLIVHGAAGAAVYGLSVYHWPEAATWPPVLVGGVLNAAAFTYATLTAWRCLAACRGAAVSARSR